MKVGHYQSNCKLLIFFEREKVVNKELTNRMFIFLHKDKSTCFYIQGPTQDFWLGAGYLKICWGFRVVDAGLNPARAAKPPGK